MIDYESDQKASNTTYNAVFFSLPQVVGTIVSPPCTKQCLGSIP